MYTVLVPKKLDEERWIHLTRWVELFCGPPGEDWDQETIGEEVAYYFRHWRHAQTFDRVWNRKPLILAYELWKEFCLNDLSRARLDAYWTEKGWTPTVVLDSPPLKKAMVVRGYRREYRQSYKCWFFEAQEDALVFWIEQNG